MYVYEGTMIIMICYTNLGVVKYFKESLYGNASMSKDVPAEAVTGTGIADTSWYDKTRPTFEIDNPDKLAGLAELVNSGVLFYKKTIRLTSV